MSITIAVPRETANGEKRVAVVPSVLKQFTKLGVEVRIQRGAGESAGFPDDLYEGVSWADDQAALYKDADVVLRVQPPSADEAANSPKKACCSGFSPPTRATPASATSTSAA